jgi:Ca-activated chloride channel family protein
VAKFPQRDMFGRVTYTTIPVDIDVDALKKIAEIGNGKFFRAADYDTIKNVYEQINQLETSKMDVKHFEHVKEYFTWALYPGILVFGLEVLLSHTWWRRAP